jgi:hypothetical protein
MDDGEIARYLRANADREEYLVRKYVKLTRYNSRALSVVLRGYMNRRASLKEGKSDVEDEARLARAAAASKVDARCLAALEDTVRLVRSHGSVLLLTFIPTLDLWNEAQPSEVKRALSVFEELARRYPRVVFLDYNRTYQSTHDMFIDPTHMNAKGQGVITAELVRDINALRATAPSESPPRGPLAATSSSRGGAAQHDSVHGVELYRTRGGAVVVPGRRLH